MVLTEQQIFDFIECPVKYHIKNELNIVLEEPYSDSIILNGVTKFFYNSLINGKLPSLKKMQNKLDSLCETHKEHITSKKAVELWAQIYRFYNWACDNKITVIDTDTHYSIPVGNHLVKGIMNPISVINDNKFEILIMNFSSRLPDQTEQDRKIKHSLDILAFNTANKDMKIIGARIHAVKNGSDIITTRGDNDFERLKSTVNNIAKSIESKLYYPRETFMCKNCSYRYYCRGWK